MRALGRQLVLLVAALQFLTRLPTPPLRAYEPDWTVRASRWFPLVGQLVGALSASVWLAAGRLWGAPAAAVLAVLAGVLATGGFHEDGLADTADGLGGGATPERRLAIMKDSRIGAFGALALVASLAVRSVAVAALKPWPGALALVAAHGAGRAAAVLAMAATPYVGDGAAAKARAGGLRPSAGEAAFAGAWGLLPLALIGWPKGAVALLLAAGGALAVAGAGRRLVGGHTGDVLGAVEQVCEAAVLLGASARL